MRTMVGVRNLVAALEGLDVLLLEEGALSRGETVDRREGQVVGPVLQRSCTQHRPEISRVALTHNAAQCEGVQGKELSIEMLQGLQQAHRGLRA